MLDFMYNEYGDAYVPRRATLYSAGYDFIAPFDITIKQNEWTTFNSGVHLQRNAIRRDDVMLILPRSSLGFKYGLRLRNTVGVIDQDYHDSIKMCVTADEDLVIKQGDKYMQGIVLPFGKVLGEISPTKERNGGIGSTDKMSE